MNLLKSIFYKIKFPFVVIATFITLIINDADDETDDEY